LQRLYVPEGSPRRPLAPPARGKLRLEVLSYAMSSRRSAPAVRRDLTKTGHQLCGREDRLTACSAGAPIHGINSAGVRKVARPAVAALTMTSG
jgi:hypothetical protein